MKDCQAIRSADAPLDQWTMNSGFTDQSQVYITFQSAIRPLCINICTYSWFCPAQHGISPMLQRHVGGSGTPCGGIFTYCFLCRDENFSRNECRSNATGNEVTKKSN